MSAAIVKVYEVSQRFILNFITPTNFETTHPNNCTENTMRFGEKPIRRSSSSYLVGGGSISRRVRSKVGELFLQLVMGAVAEAVDHGGGQQHGHDAQDGDHGENQELGGLGLAVLGGDLVDVVPLQWQAKDKRAGWGSVTFACTTAFLEQLIFTSPL